MSMLSKLGSNLLYGTARTTGRFGAIGGLVYTGYNYLGNKVGGTAAKLLLGVSGLAIAYAAFQGIKSAVSNTWGLVKAAAVTAVAATGLYYLTSKFNLNSLDQIQAPSMTTSALDIDSAIDAAQLGKTLTNPPNNPNLGTSFADTAVGRNIPAGLSTPTLGTPPNIDTAPTRGIAPEIDLESPKQPNTPTADLTPKLQTTFADAPSSVNAPEAPRAANIDTPPSANINRAPAPFVETESLKGRAAAQEFIENTDNAGLLRRLQNINPLAKTGRLGANIPIVGQGVGVSMASLTSYASSLQRAFALSLFTAGLLGDTPEENQAAYDAYLDMNGKNEALLLADVGASTLDPTGASIVFTAGAEYMAHGNFQDWMDRYAANLSPEIAEGLSMSLFMPDTIHADVAHNLWSDLPTSPLVEHPELNAVIEAKIAFVESVNAERNVNAHMIAIPDVREAEIAKLEGYWENVNNARTTFREEIANVMQDSTAFNAALSVSSPRQLLNTIDRFTLSETRDLTTLATQHPQIAAYISATTDDKWFNHRGPADALKDNPELMNAYITDRFGLSEEQVPVAKPSSPQQEQFVAATTHTQPAPVQGGAPAMDNRMAAFRPDI